VQRVALLEVRRGIDEAALLVRERADDVGVIGHGDRLGQRRAVAADHLRERELAVDRRGRRSVQVLDRELDGEQRPLALALRLHDGDARQVIAKLRVHRLRRATARELGDFLRALEDARLAARPAAQRFGGDRLLGRVRIRLGPARHVGVLAAFARGGRRAPVRRDAGLGTLRRGRRRLLLVAAGRQQGHQGEGDEAWSVTRWHGRVHRRISTAAAPT
jgi:hypothetical protein